MRGTVLFWVDHEDRRGGYGFIVPDDVPEKREANYYFGPKALKGINGWLTVRSGDRVDFDEGNYRPGKGPCASHVRLLAEDEIETINPMPDCGHGEGTARLKGTVTHWSSVALYGFVTGEDGKEYVLHEDDLPAWARAANCRLGMVVEFEAVDIGSRKLSAFNVYVIIDQRSNAHEAALM